MAKAYKRKTSRARWNDSLPWRVTKRKAARPPRNFAIPHRTHMPRFLRALYGPEGPDSLQASRMVRALEGSSIFVRPLFVGDRAQKAPVLRKDPAKLVQFLAANVGELVTQRFAAWTPYTRPHLCTEPVFAWTGPVLFGSTECVPAVKVEAAFAVYAANYPGIDPLDLVEKRKAAAFWEPGSEIVWIVASRELEAPRIDPRFPICRYDAEKPLPIEREGAA